MKTLVTHINPHLDDIFGIWLYKKYMPDSSGAPVEFISASREAAAKSEDKIFIGTGGGDFDEHKEGLKTCAGTLVFEYVGEHTFLPEDEITIKALEEMVEWNLLLDTGKMPVREWGEFDVPAFIRPLDGSSEESLKAVELGKEILDRILEVLKRKQQAILDWANAVEFESKFGKSYGIISGTVNREFCREKGGDLFLMYDPKKSSVQYFTPSFEVDLEPIYNKVKELDPAASWFLHQSHHMVICGSGAAPDFQKTKLSFEELIEAAK
ncbi:MAG: hypothetical protein Q7R49_06795 [Candidatus Daviesbacteria bacterium]|nr:hypothetical protein [Candidatus Daviesbacteria bacterium]